MPGRSCRGARRSDRGRLPWVRQGGAGRADWPATRKTAVRASDKKEGGTGHGRQPRRRGQGPAAAARASRRPSCRTGNAAYGEARSPGLSCRLRQGRAAPVSSRRRNTLRSARPRRAARIRHGRARAQTHSAGSQNKRSRQTAPSASGISPYGFIIASNVGPVGARWHREPWPGSGSDKPSPACRRILVSSAACRPAAVSCRQENPTSLA